jgi:hydrogenase maturation protease
LGLQKKWLVTGIGADFRGDDSFGLMVIDYLQTHSLGSSVVLKKCNDISKLYYDFQPDLNLILIDAVKDDQRPLASEVCWRVADRDLPKDPILTSSHSIGLADSLAMAKVLGNLPQNIIFFGVVGKQFGLGEACSSAVKEKVEETGLRILHDYLLKPRVPAKGVVVE